MSQLTLKDITRQVSTKYGTTFLIRNNPPGVCTAAMQTRGSFHRLLVFFLETTQLLSIFARTLKADHAFSYARASASWGPGCSLTDSFWK